MSCPDVTQASTDDIVIIFSAASEIAQLWAPYLTTCFDRINHQRTTSGKQQPLKVLQLPLEELQQGSLIEQRCASVRLQIIILCPTVLNHLQEFSNNTLLRRVLRPDRALGLLLGVTDRDVTTGTVDLNWSTWRRLPVRDQDRQPVDEFLRTALNILQSSTLVAPPKTPFSVVPKKVRSGARRILLLLTEPLLTEDVIRVRVQTQEVAVRRRNPYTLQVSVPETFVAVSQLVRIAVEKNGTSLGTQPIKCESRLRELDQLLRTAQTPLDFMCQTLGLSTANHEQLDKFLVQNFQKNVPPHFNLLQGGGGFLNGNNSRFLHAEEYPTLLHFAARFGLERLAWQLLECPGGERACELRNVHDFTPADLAENAGQARLAHTLRSHHQMNEFSNFYHLMKGMTKADQEEDDLEGAKGGEEYILPRPLGETYSVPPSARPLSPIAGYLQMTSTKPTAALATSPSITSATSTTCLDDPLQAELADILNEFKLQVRGIAEVEQLVERWKSRNDVQQSTVDKHEALMRMREEYERVQRRLKEESRSNTAFDRIKRLFSRNKSGPSTSGSVSTRPASSLSQSSSSSSSGASSARMSTASDSGTHSDADDRKAGNYLVPPAPKSVWRFAPTEEEEKEKPKPTDFYIQFPPSGAPVEPVLQRIVEQPCTTDHEQYINLSAQIAQMELQIKETDEDAEGEEDCLLPPYINFQPVRTPPPPSTDKK